MSGNPTYRVELSCISDSFCVSSQPPATHSTARQSMSRIGGLVTESVLVQGLAQACVSYFSVAVLIRNPGTL
jgi:hypothetical protein